MRGPPSCPNRPRITFPTTDRDVVERVAALFGVKYVCASQDKRNPKWKPYFLVCLRDARAVAMMKLLRPFMGHRRQGQIDAALMSYKPKREPLTEIQIQEIHRRARTEPVKQLVQEYKVAAKRIREIRDAA